MKYKSLTSKDYKWVKLTAEDIKGFPEGAIANIKDKSGAIKKIYKTKDSQTFANTILAYENMAQDEYVLYTQIATLSMCSPDALVRDAAREVEVKFSSGIIDIIYDIDLYKAIKFYFDNNYKEDKKSLDTESLKLVDDIMKGFARMGFDLPQKERNRLKVISKKISKLANDYDARIAEDKSHILCSVEELHGVPENIINSFTKIGDKYKVSIQYPEYGPYMTYATDRKKKEELFLLFNNVGGLKNVKILEELVKLRKEKSDLLGFNNHAEYKASDRMAKNTKRISEMLTEVIDKLQDKKVTDYIMLEQKGVELGINKKDIKVSDLDYIQNIVRKEKYSYDEQIVREYFPLDHVLSSMFELFGEMFGFNVIEKEIKLWHKDVKAYAVVDNKSKEEIGHMIMDLYPREGKFSHACMMPIIGGMALERDQYQTPMIAIICNFSKPVTKGKNKIPSLLTLGEVETLYHEFGHGLHAMLTKAKYGSHAGTNVVFDFVEAPSQIMEEWVTDEKVLKKISSHYETGKAMPNDIIKKIKSLDKFLKAVFYTRQAVQSMLDLDIYTGKVKDGETVAHYHKLCKKYLRETLPGVLFVSRFAHIARGYDAGYYSYMWAERISKDMYREFVKVSSSKSDTKKIGAKYRKEILEMGGSRDENESVLAFLGRPVDSASFAGSIL